MGGLVVPVVHDGIFGERRILHLDDREEQMSGRDHTMMETLDGRLVLVPLYYYGVTELSQVEWVCLYEHA